MSKVKDVTDRVCAAETDLNIARAETEQAKKEGEDALLRYKRESDEMVKKVVEEATREMTIVYQDAFQTVKDLVATQYPDLDLSKVTVEAAMAALAEDTEGTTVRPDAEGDEGEEEVQQDGR